jgi:hypothetical protein
VPPPSIVAPAKPALEQDCALRRRSRRSKNRLAWSNLAAQSAEQVALAAAPMVAVLALGAGAGETDMRLCACPQVWQAIDCVRAVLPTGVTLRVVATSPGRARPSPPLHRAIVEVL